MIALRRVIIEMHHEVEARPAEMIDVSLVHEVCGHDADDELFEAANPLIVGLIKDPKRLIEIRRQRLKFLNQDENTDYVNPELVHEEVKDARKLFVKQGWPTINVTRRSIEETAATIIQMLNKKREIEM